MATKIILDPVTRIEGHLRIDAEIEGGKVVNAKSKGEMFRGLEEMLTGRDPLDAPIIMQRICGVCPVSHGLGSTFALEDAMGIQPNNNGMYLRNLILGANYLQSHILHFYHLSALDFVQVEDILKYEGHDPVLAELKAWAQGELASNKILPVAPFLPKLPGDYPKDTNWNINAIAHYVEALEMRKEAHKMLSLFGGKMPHITTLTPGGLTCGVSPGDIESFRARLKRIQNFIVNVYIPDVLEAARLYPQYAKIGRGVQRFLSYGVFDEGGTRWLPAGVVEGGRFQKLDTSRITEDVRYSYYTQKSGLHPSQGETNPDPKKAGAYSWLKAPLYDGKTMEVGPLARVIVALESGEAGWMAKPATDLLKEAKMTVADLPSVLGRHATRALEALLVAERMDTWLNRLKPGQPTTVPYNPKKSGRGEGLIEAPRGALGHWIEIKDLKIERYQCVVPSTWTFAPKSDRGDHGPVEEAIMGTAVTPASKGLEIARIVRSFDPCIACAIH